MRKEFDKAVYCHPIFNLYAEHIMRNARLDESQAGIKIARRNINNLRYVDDTPVMTESEEELKSLFTFCHYSSIIHLSEVVDVSSTYLDSSL